MIKKIRHSPVTRIVAESESLPRRSANTVINRDC